MSNDDEHDVEGQSLMANVSSVHAFSVFSVANEHPESVELLVRGVHLTAVIDSGSSSNILDKQTWELLKKKNIKCTSKKQTKMIQNCMLMGSQNQST